MFREDAGYSRKEAAERIGISARTLASYERGEREISMDTAIRMAMAYGTTFTKLTDYKNAEVALNSDYDLAMRTGATGYDRQSL